MFLSGLRCVPPRAGHRAVCPCARHVVGVLLGSRLARPMNSADRSHWMAEQSRLIIALVTPPLGDTVTVVADGFGFVAAFVCGVAFR